MNIKRLCLGIRNKALGVGALSRQNEALHKELASLKTDLAGLQASMTANHKDESTILEQILSKLSEQEKALSIIQSSSARAKDALDVFSGRIERAISAKYLSDADQTRFLSFVRKFRPLAADDNTKIRVGRTGDGGYVMIDSFESISTAFSCGIGNEVTWDLGIVERGITVHQFDHTIEGPPALHPGIFFHKKQVSHTSGPDRITLQEMLELNGDKSAKGPILKMDIEHDEWRVLAETDPDTLAKFSQIVVEFHTIWRIYENDWLAVAEVAIQNVKRNFEVVHVHANNAASFVNIGNVVFPEMIEVTFFNKSLSSFSVSKEIFPTELDSPNNTGIADLHLGNFIY